MNKSFHRLARALFPRDQNPGKMRGSSLITTLLVITVLTIIVIAFMQSMSIEKLTSRSYANKLQASLLAKSAESVAVSKLLRTVEEGPFATSFSTEAANGAPYLFYAKRVLENSTPTIIRHPLFSTLNDSVNGLPAGQAFVSGNSITLSDLNSNGATVQRNLTNSSDIFCNMNARWGLYNSPFLGLANADGSPLAIPVNWIYVRDTAGRVVGRFAYWVDDESSKLDLRTAGNRRGTGQTHARGFGTNPDEVSLAPLSALGLSPDQIAELEAYKANPSPLEAASEVNHEMDDSLVSARLRPFLTTSSLEDPRGPDGKRKLDLNALITSSRDPARMQLEIDTIVETIADTAPEFGRRFYRESAVSSTDQRAYLYKIAANIKDFVDTDNQPTMLLRNASGDWVVSTSNAPDFIPYELIDADLPIIGKERGPFLTEYMRVARVITPHFSTTGVALPLTFRLAHYIELHNPSNQPITFADLGPNPHILLANREPWRQTGLGEPAVVRPADLRINLPDNLVIPPNGYVVITTDGPPFMDSQSDYFSPAGDQRYVITKGTHANEPGTWRSVDAGGQTLPDAASGFEDYSITTQVDVNLNDSNQNRYRFGVGEQNVSYINNRERLLLLTEEGVVDAAPRIYTNALFYLVPNIRNPQVTSTFLSDSFTESRNTLSDSGTQPRLTRGDPRSNLEISGIGNNTGHVWKNGGSVYGNNFATSSLQQTLGLPNVRSNEEATLSGVNLWRRGWREFTTDTAGNHFVPNRPLRSVGELGFVYDPSRFSNNQFRSYGSTLRLGQSDDPTNHRGTTTGADFQNWLGGLGNNNPTNARFFQNAFQLLEAFRVSDNATGKINPSSIVRDRTGLVFQSLTNGFRFNEQPSVGAPDAASKLLEMPSSALSNREINASGVVEGIRGLLTSGNVITNIGEIGRANVFHTGSNLSPSINTATVSDAGREEFFRRSSELLSVQSLAFTIHIVAQAGRIQENNRFQASSTSTREFTLQISPEFEEDPTNLRPEPSSWSVIPKRILEL